MYKKIDLTISGELSQRSKAKLRLCNIRRLKRISEIVKEIREN